MEYLMTYGWALLVIVIVLAVLLIINPFRSPEQCSFSDATLSCGKPLMKTGTNDNLYGTVTNGFAQSITLKGYLCTNDRAVTPPADPGTAPAQKIDPNVNVAPQGQFLMGGDKGTKITCTKANGIALQAGEDYNGILYLYYNLADDQSNFPPRITKGTLTTKVQQ
jgi:hypothetical protein